MLESVVKSKARADLQEAGWLVVHLMQTNHNGIPDTLALRNGTVVFIEFKREGEEPEALQLFRHKQLRAHGFIVIIVRGYLDYRHLLRK
jgi:hypothetical protein